MINEQGLLQWIQEWFYSNCDGDWEHNENFTIRTLDNPGWSLEINLEGTACEGRKFVKLKIERDSNDWYHCFLRDGKFHSAGGPRNLIDILETFRDWAEECQKR